MSSIDSLGTRPVSSVSPKIITPSPTDTKTSEASKSVFMRLPGDSPTLLSIMDRRPDSVLCFTPIGHDSDIHEAAREGSPGEIRDFLDQFRDTKKMVNARDSSGKTPLQIAIQENQLERVKLLFDYGASYEDQLIFLAARYANLELFQYILSKRPSDASCAYTLKEPIKENTLLHAAANHAHFDTVKFLLENGANVNALNLAKESPLHYATLAFGGFELGLSITIDKISRTIRTLLDHGADLNTRNALNQSPLHLMIEFGDHSILTRPSKERITELAELIKLFLMKGAKVSNSRIEGETMFHLAIKLAKKYPEVAKVIPFLIGKLHEKQREKAIYVTLDSDGKTVYDYAEGHPKLVKLLENPIEDIPPELPPLPTVFDCSGGAARGGGKSN